MCMHASTYDSNVGPPAYRPGTLPYTELPIGHPVIKPTVFHFFFFFGIVFKLSFEYSILESWKLKPHYNVSVVTSWIRRKYSVLGVSDDADSRWLHFVAQLFYSNIARPVYWYSIFHASSSIMLGTSHKAEVGNIIGITDQFTSTILGIFVWRGDYTVYLYRYQLCYVNMQKIEIMLYIYISRRRRKNIFCEL